MQLDRFQPGLVYEVGPIMGAVLLAEQWAEPVDDTHDGLVTPVTSVRGFSDDRKPVRGWHRRWVHRPAERALAADRSTSRSRKPSRRKKKGR